MSAKARAPKAANPTNGVTIKDAAVGKGVFTLVQRGSKSYIHYNLPQGYLLFAVKNDDALAMEINNHLADVLEREHGKSTREALVQFASESGAEPQRSTNQG